MLVKRVLIIVAVVALAAAGYWFLWPKADVVAIVNGQAISRTELAARLEDVKLQYSMYGMELTAAMEAELATEILDDLIDEALLLQGAKAAGVEVSEAEIEDYYELLVASYGGEAAFLALLAETNNTTETIKVSIGQHMTIQQYERSYIEANVPPELLVITEEEILELYAYYTMFIEDIPPLAEVSHHLEQELYEEKVAELDILRNLLQQLRAEATIEIRL